MAARPAEVPNLELAATLRGRALSLWRRALRLLEKELHRFERRKTPAVEGDFCRRLEIATNAISKLTIDPNKVPKSRPPADPPAEHDSDPADLSTIKMRPEAIAPGSTKRRA